jgi:nucleotide-binding universal stress UspA family protein
MTTKSRETSAAGIAVAMGGEAGKDRPTILAATEGSDAALRSAELAVGLAVLLGAKLHVLYVLDQDGALMGVNGTSRLGHVLFGSIAEEVSRRADRSVSLVGGKPALTEPLLARPER